MLSIFHNTILKTDNADKTPMIARINLVIMIKVILVILLAI